MSEKITPAIADADWLDADHARTDLLFEGEPAGCYAHIDEGPHRIEIGIRGEDGLEKYWLIIPDDFAALLAICNAALPADDPRKITREWVVALRAEAERGEYAERVGDNAGFSAIDPSLARQIAAALESYLPPEGV